MPVLFLSHAGVDSEAARELKRRLEESPTGKDAKLEVWFDKSELQPGTDGWQEQLERAINEESTAFAVYMGSKGVVTWVRREVRLALSRATVDETYPFIPVFAPDSPGPRGLPPFAQQHQGVRDPLHDPTALMALLDAALGRTDKSPPELLDEPYVGFRSMEEGEADRFFGREAELDELIERLRNRRLLALVADSGTGKSSLVRAGLIPAWRRHELADPNRTEPDKAAWHVVVTRPGANPTEELIKAVTVAATNLECSDQAKTAFRKGIDLGNLSETAYNLACGLPPDTTDTLLVVDQFEELFTQTPTDRRRAFVDLLLFLVGPQNTALKFRVVLTMRADYVNLLRDFPELRTALGMDNAADPEQSGEVRLKALSPQGIARIVHEPMRLAGHRDRGERDKLLTAIRYDLGTNPGDTALLAVALYRLWKKRDPARSQALVAVYEEIGRVAGALASTADEAVEGLSDHLLEGLWARLVQAGYGRAGTRRVARLDEFDKDRRKVAQSLAGEDHGRLLLAGAETVEISHEALIAQWSVLQEFVRANGDDLRRFGRLMEKNEAWHPPGSQAPAGAPPSPPLPLPKRLASIASRLLSFRPPDPNANPDHLAGGADLETFVDLAKRRDNWLNDGERSLIEQSLIEQARERHNEQQTLKVLAYSAVALLIVATVAGQQWWQATTNYKEARNNEGRALSALASAATASGAPFDALRLAIASWPRHAGDVDRPMLTRVLDTLSASVVALPILDSRQFGETAATAFSADGRRLAAWAGRTAVLIDVASGADVGSLPSLNSNIGGAVFSSDGRRLAIWGGRTVTVRDAATGAVVGSPAPASTDIREVTFSADGQRLAILMERAVTLLDAGNGGAVGSVAPFSNDIRRLLWAGDGRRLAVWAGQTVTLVDAIKGAAVGSPQRFGDGILGFRWTKDSQRVVIWSRRTVALVDAADGSPIGPLPSFSDGIRTVIFAADSRRLVISDIRTAALIDARTGASVGPIPPFGGAGVQGAVLSDDGQRLAIRSGRTVTVFDTRSGTAAGSPVPFADNALKMFFSPDSRRLAVLARRSGSMIDTVTGAVVGSIAVTGNSTGIIFSPDSQRLVTMEERPVLIDAAAAGTIATLPASDNSGGRSVRFSADSQRLILKSGRTAALIDAATGATVASLSPFNDDIQDVAFSADSRSFIVWSGRMAALIDAATGATIGSLLPFGEDIERCVFSADGRRLTVLTGKTVTLIDIGGRTAVASLAAFSENIQGIVFSADGRRLAAYAGPTATLIDAASGAVVGPFPPFNDAVQGVAFSGDSRRLALRAGRSAALIDTAAGTGVSSLPSFDSEIENIIFSGDSQRLAILAGRQVMLIDASTGAVKGPLPAFSDSVRTVVFSADNRRLVIEAGRQTTLFDAATGTAVGSPFSTGGEFEGGVMLSADGRRLAIYDGRVLAFVDTGTGMAVGSPPPFGEDIQNVVFSLNSHRLAMWSARTMAILDPTGGTSVGQLSSVNDDIEEIVFSADGRRLAIWAGRTVKLVDGQTGAAIGSIPPFSDEIRRMDFFADGRRLAIWTGSGATLIDATTGTVSGSLPSVGDDIQEVMFSPDRQHMAVLAGRRLALFDIVNGHLAGESPLNAGFESSPAATFSPDGKFLTVMSRKDVVIVDSVSGRAIAHIQADAFAPQDKDARPQTVLAARIVGKRLLVERLALPPGDHLLDIACKRLPGHARDLGSVGQKHGIKINDPICVPVPPPPDWKRIARETASR